MPADAGARPRPGGWGARTSSEATTAAASTPEPGVTPLAANVAPFRALVELLQLETCTTAGLTTTCPLGDMLPGEVVTLRFTGQVPAGAADGTVFTDTAAITATGDTVPANDVDGADVTVDAATGEPPPPPGPGPAPGPGEGPGGGPGAAPAPGPPIHPVARGGSR